MNLQPLFEKAFERFNNLPAAAALAPPKKKRARALSGAINAEDEEGDSPTLHCDSTPGTMSPTDPTTQSPAQRVIATPVSPMEGHKRLSSSPNVFGTNFSISPDHANRRRSYDLYQAADYNVQSSDSPMQQPPATSMGFQPNLASNGMPDLSTMMFPTNDLFSFVPHNMVPTVQQHTAKDEQTNPMSSTVYPSVSNGNQFGRLEGNLLGPLPPYLLQGQQSLMGEYLGPGCQSQGQRMDGSGIDTATSGQFFMPSCGGGDATVQDFFRDDWEDTLMNTFRST